MKKSKKVITLVLKFIGKYIIPIVLGYLEGNSHAVTDTISNLF